jgi:hypothetical protein
VLSESIAQEPAKVTAILIVQEDGTAIHARWVTCNGTPGTSSRGSRGMTEFVIDGPPA